MWRETFFWGKHLPFSITKQIKLKIAPQLKVNEYNIEYKFNHMFCWKIDIPFFPFMSFSITTPANPARPEEHTVKNAGRKGMESWFWPDFAIWIEATLDVSRRREAHWTPERLCLE